MGELVIFFFFWVMLVLCKVSSNDIITSVPLVDPLLIQLDEGSFAKSRAHIIIDRILLLYLSLFDKWKQTHGISNWLVALIL